MIYLNNTDRKSNININLTNSASLYIGDISYMS